mgnify:CR=1 FL=1|tara:strand:- start:440 stop:622 length:183 start_codon:yes stop_codon:yes gene_type:complete
MTPFEQAEENIRKLAENLSFAGLIQATIEETKHLSKEDSDLIWETVLAMLMVADRMADNN